MAKPKHNLDFLPTETHPKPHNSVMQAKVRKGLFGLISGEDMTSVVTREITAMNNDGYRLVFIMEDEFSAYRKAGSRILWILTLGIWRYDPGLLLIGERID